MALRDRWTTAVTCVVLVVSAGALRLLVHPGADLDRRSQELLGRAPRLDAYWYTRPAIDRSRGLTVDDAARPFDRPLVSAWNRGFFVTLGAGDRTVALPALVAGSLVVGLTFLLGRLGGFPLGVAALAGAFACTSWVVVLHDSEPLVYSVVNLGLLGAVAVWLGGVRRPLLYAIGWLLFLSVAVLGKETVLLAAPGLAIAQVRSRGPSVRGQTVAALVMVAAALALGVVAALAAPSLASDFLAKWHARLDPGAVLSPARWLALLAGLPAVFSVVGLVPALAVLVICGGTAVLLERTPAAPDRGAVFRRLILWWLIGGAVAAGVLAYRPTRYLLGLAPAAFLLAAYGAAVLAGAVEAPVRRWPRTAAAVLFLAWWSGLATVAAFALPAVPPGRVAAWLALPAVRLAVSAFFAVLIAARQAESLAASGRISPAPRYAIALAVLVFASDAQGLARRFLEPTFEDLRARDAFEAIVGPGARVQGYAAHYLALDPRYRVTVDFEIRPDEVVRNSTGSTHIATLWVPELAYVERMLAERGTTLQHVADVVVSHERYRIYRRGDAESRGYTLTPFERARQLEGTDAGGAAQAFARLAEAPEAAPVVLTWAGRAIGRVDAAAGEELLQRCLANVPQEPVALLHLAEIALRRGETARAVALRAEAARLLPHELILGLGS